LLTRAALLEALFGCWPGRLHTILLTNLTSLVVSNANSFQIEWAPSVDAGVTWQPGDTVTMTNAFRIMPPSAATEPQRFYRAKQL
jgi:hypothetical protein